MAFMLAAAKPKWSPRAKAAETAKAQLITLPRVSICFIMPNIGILLASVATIPAAAILFIFSSLPTLISGFSNQRVSSSTIGYAPNRTQEIDPITSMARITSPGLSPGDIKMGSRPGISSQPSRNFTTAAARPMVINATRNLAKIWKPLIIFSGMNFSPSATRIATMITGIIFIRISAKVNSTGWPLICTPEYIATRPPAIQPIGMVTIPASTPSAR